jgi:hypothetical protein
MCARAVQGRAPPDVPVPELPEVPEPPGPESLGGALPGEVLLPPALPEPLVVPPAELPPIVPLAGGAPAAGGVLCSVRSGALAVEPVEELLDPVVLLPDFGDLSQAASRGKAAMAAIRMRVLMGVMGVLLRRVCCVIPRFAHGAAP